MRFEHYVIQLPRRTQRWRGRRLQELVAMGRRLQELVAMGRRLRIVVSNVFKHGCNVWHKEALPGLR